jgi:hypothetical protein
MSPGSANLVHCYSGYSAGFSSEGHLPAVGSHARSTGTLRAERVPEKEKHMRHTIIVAATTALVTAIVAIWGTTIIIAHTERHPEAAMASASIEVLRMMRDAKGLPEEQFDAH